MIEFTPIQPYPFTEQENEQNIQTAIEENMHTLLQDELFQDTDQEALLQSFRDHIMRVEGLFAHEEQARNQGIEGANLYYHNKHHGAFQITYDTISLLRQVLGRKDVMTSYITPEGVFGGVLGSLYHDTGYVTDPFSTNYANRTPVHVDESMLCLWRSLRKLDIPNGLDFKRVENIGILSIHATNFPYTKTHEQEAREVLDQLAPHERKEAQIIRLTVQLADLGGQSARTDQNPTLLQKLREEMNARGENLGTTVIGNDDNLNQNYHTFIEKVVLPTVGKTAQAIYLSPDNPYSLRWK